jgi:hypothetical protein
MPVERAVTAYQHERLNCAQSVLRAFQKQHELSDETIQKARNLGHGRADSGVCGALHAAQQLVRTPSARERLTEAFVSEAGSDKCREIRRAGRIPCVGCVRLAAGLVVHHGETDCGGEGGSPAAPKEK